MLVVQVEQNSHVTDVILAQQRGQQLLGLLGSILLAGWHES